MKPLSGRKKGSYASITVSDVWRGACDTARGTH